MKYYSRKEYINKRNKYYKKNTVNIYFYTYQIGLYPYCTNKRINKCNAFTTTTISCLLLWIHLEVIQISKKLLLHLHKKLEFRSRFLQTYKLLLLIPWEWTPRHIQSTHYAGMSCDHRPSIHWLEHVTVHSLWLKSGYESSFRWLRP